MSVCRHPSERLLCEELYTEHFQGRLYTQAMSSNKPVPGCPGISARTVFSPSPFSFSRTWTSYNKMALQLVTRMWHGRIYGTKRKVLRWCRSFIVSFGEYWIHKWSALLLFQGEWRLKCYNRDFVVVAILIDNLGGLLLLFDYCLG